MKIESTTITEQNLKTKLENATDYQTQDGLGFRDILSGAFNAQNFLQGDFLVSDFLTSSDDVNDLKSSYKYDCLTMDRQDAMFFANAVKGENYSFNVNGELLMQNMATTAEAVSQTYKSSEVSKTLMDMLSSSQQTNKPVRIDFGNDISAILRVSRDGKISAEFIPSDKAAEEYLKNNISYLQQTFDKEDIPYNELTYKQRFKDRQNQGRNQNQSQDEKGET